MHRRPVRKPATAARPGESQRPGPSAAARHLRRLGLDAMEPVRCRCQPGAGRTSHRARGRSSMAEPQPSKLVMRVRFPSPAPTTNPRSGQVPPKRRVTIKKPSPSVVPDTCPIGCCWHPSAGPRRAPPPWPPRSPHPAPSWRAGKSSRHVCLCDPSVPSAHAGSRPWQPPSCSPYAADRASADQASQPRPAT